MVADATSDFYVEHLKRLKKTGIQPYFSGHLLAVLTALCQLARGGREVDEPVPFVNASRGERPTQSSRTQSCDPRKTSAIRLQRHPAQYLPY
jgi:hypothetical protein